MEDNESIIRTFVIKLDVPIVFITNATKEQILNADDGDMCIGDVLQNNAGQVSLKEKLSMRS